MPLGMEVGLSPDDFVLDGDPAPNFRRMSIVAKRLEGSRGGRWIMEVDVGSGHIVLDGDPGDRVSNFRPISILAKRLDASGCHLVWT